jgi:hypothetical protein
MAADGRYSRFGIGFSDFAVQADDFVACSHKGLFNTLFGERNANLSNFRTGNEMTVG